MSDDIGIMSIKKIELPFNTAVGRAARQNFNKDVRNGKVNMFEWVEDQDIQRRYHSEARALLLRDGENMIPEFPDVEHIFLQKSESK